MIESGFKEKGEFMMAKIKLSNNNMAMFMVCEAIGEERKEFMDIKPDADGLYDINITLNGKEINAERFLKSLQTSYNNSVRKCGADLLSMEYDKMLNSIHEIQEMLEHHHKIFDKKEIDALSWSKAIKELVARFKEKVDICICGYDREEVEQDVFDTIDNIAEEMIRQMKECF